MTKAGGSIAAAPIWHDYMTKALANTNVEQFQRPSGVKTVTLDAITGRQPSTGRSITDIFGSWYKIPDGANGSQTAKVDKLSGKLATNLCPDEVVETRTTSAITAEIPSSDASYPRWFAPIAAWASENGFPTSAGGSLPTEKCDIHTGKDLPAVNITSPSDGESVNQNFKLNIALEVPADIQSVKVTVGATTYDASGSGTSYSLNLNGVPTGKQAITVTVKDNKYQTASDSITVTVK